MPRRVQVIRVGFFWLDVGIVKKHLERANAELEKGGDWERRNKLRVWTSSAIAQTCSSTVYVILECGNEFPGLFNQCSVPLERNHFQARSASGTVWALCLVMGLFST